MKICCVKPPMIVRKLLKLIFLNRKSKMINKKSGESPDFCFVYKFYIISTIISFAISSFS